MRTPRYNNVPVFGDDIRTTQRQYANYGGFLRCLGTLVLTVVLFLVTLVCLFVGLYALYPLDPPAPTNILILGADHRASSEELADTARTDAIMVVSIDPEREQIAVLSIPRDLILNAPAYGRLRANSVVREAELNNPGSGRAEMAAAVENTFDIEIDHVMWLDFQGFVDVIDAVGGVEIDVPRTIVDTRFPLPDDSGTTTVRFDAGLQWMSGETALQYARTRQADDDYARAARQQQVIAAAMQKFEDPVYWLRLPQVMMAANNNTESDFTVADVVRYLPGVLHYQDRIETQVITREFIELDGAVALPNIEALRPWLDEHLVHRTPTVEDADED
jgi:LCP family protein required for cell wall assembly